MRGRSLRGYIVRSICEENACINSWSANLGPYRHRLSLGFQYMPVALLPLGERSYRKARQYMRTTR